MFEFTIFRIPVRVEPWFWLVSFFMGGGMRINGREGILNVLLWMIIVFVSILIHELGHAMTSRKLTKVQPDIKLWGMGGLAYPNTKLTKQESFWVTLAGPLAGLAFYGVIVIACIVAYGGEAGFGIAKWLTYSGFGMSPPAYLALIEMEPTTFRIISALIFVNFWWSLVNLLPVYPLDGGHIYATFENSERKVYQVGMVTGIIAAVVGLTHFKSLYVGLLFGYLAYQNYQRYKMITGWKR